MSRPFFVELPGIEPDTQIALTYANAEIGYAGLRETTPNDLRTRERC